MTSPGVLAITVSLLVAGIAGSILPAIPGALLSLSGVLFHWWATGYTTPGTLALVTFIGLAAGAILIDLFGGAMAASHAGASKLTVGAAVGVSIVLAVFTGPLGILIGVPTSVFLIELYWNGDSGQAGRTALLTTLGIFGSTLVQVLLTSTILFGFVVVILS